MQPAPFIAWVDYSEAERDLMRRTLLLFKETETRDELGLGAIRDALSDLMFPGTSTIQTRLRYFLFVPWLYQSLESRPKLNPRDLEQALRKKELALIGPLKEDDDDIGVFGKVAGHTVTRLPSSVYWNGLRTWGIFRPSLTQDEFHRSWSDVHELRKQSVQPDDKGIAANEVHVWDHTLPEPPPGDWVKTATFALTKTEALYLQEKMHLGQCGGSLLAHFVVRGRADVHAAFPWTAVSAAALPERLRELLRHSEVFSTLMYGASLLYNLALSRRSTFERHTERIDSYEEGLATWSLQAKSVAENWRAEHLWDFLAKNDHPVPKHRGDRRFVEQWTELAKSNPKGVADNELASRLVELRERELKRGERSRFANPKALARWSGASGTRQLNYRWHRVQRLLADLYTGLDQPDPAAE